MRVIDTCRCGRHHRNARTFAKCLWPNAASITGSGFIAFISICDDPVIVLFSRIAPARLHLREMQVFGCRRGCTQEHELAAVDIDSHITASFA